MSDKVTIITLILAAIPTTIASIVAAIVAIRSARAAEKGVKVAEEGVKLAEKGTKLAEETHNMVNGAMLIQLRLHAKTARELANVKPDDLEALSIAEQAETMLNEHKDKLINIDSGVAT